MGWGSLLYPDGEGGYTTLSGKGTPDATLPTRKSTKASLPGVEPLMACDGERFIFTGLAVLPAVSSLSNSD